MSFSAIKGQDQAVHLLKSYIDNSRFEGGYLFTGPEGVGKKMAAIALAQGLNCQNESFDLCDTCPSCSKIKAGQHPDIYIISEDGSEIRIDAIRQLQKRISFRPYEASYKVFIINNAHTLTAEASGALLKILEEPPSKSPIILITEKPNLLFKTIISRCKAIKFNSLKRQALEEILKTEYSLDNDLAHFLAFFSEGRIGRALSLKDSDIMFKKNNIFDKVILKDKPSADAFMTSDRVEIRNFLNILAAWFRDIYILKIGMPEKEIINIDRRNQLQETLKRFSFTDLASNFVSLSNALISLEHNVNTRLLLANFEVELWKE